MYISYLSDDCVQLAFNILLHPLLESLSGSLGTVAVGFVGALFALLLGPQW